MKQSELLDSWNHPPYSAEVARGEEKSKQTWDNSKFVAQCILCGSIALAGVVYIVFSTFTKDGVFHPEIGKMFFQTIKTCLAVLVGLIVIEFIFFKTLPETPTLNKFKDDVSTLEDELGLYSGSCYKSEYTHGVLRDCAIAKMEAHLNHVYGQQVHQRNMSIIQNAAQVFRAARRFQLVDNSERPRIIDSYESFLTKVPTLPSEDRTETY